jgi:hypothetical protein
MIPDEAQASERLSLEEAEELQKLRELQQNIISRMRGDAGLPELETVSKSEAFGSPEIKALLRQMNPRVKTERGLLNVAYRLRAVTNLMHIPECSWLYGDKTAEKDTAKSTILMELGKIKDIDVMTATALILCQLKPKGKQGALMVRNIRLGKNQGDIISLANEVIQTINGYMNRYEMSSESVLEALQVAYQKTEEMRQREEKDT